MANPLLPIDVDRIPANVVGVAADFDHASVIPSHRHERGQLVYASSGVMTVTTEGGTWVVPPQRAVWVPGGVTHRIRMSGRVEMRSVYLSGTALAGLPDACRVVAVSALLRELLIRVVAMPQPMPCGGPEERIARVLLDEIRTTEVAPLHLPRPSDPRARWVADTLQASPDDERGLAAWAREAGASPRTLARLFQGETGMSFGAWRRQLRLLHALERLASGEPVTSIALSLGYRGPSAFIAMFRRSLGRTPGSYFRSAEPVAGPATRPADSEGG